jgi:hypothetical protein
MHIDFMHIYSFPRRKRRIKRRIKRSTKTRKTRRKRSTRTSWRFQNNEDQETAFNAFSTGLTTGKPFVKHETGKEAQGLGAG